MAEERRVCASGLVVQRRAMCQRGERRCGLVETDVSVRAEPQHQQVDAARRFDGAFVARALPYDIACASIEEMPPRPGDVDVIEEMTPHVGVVASRMIRVDADKFIHVECRDS